MPNSIIPLTFCKVPPNCIVIEILATAINPWTGIPQRVKVEAVYFVNLLSQDGEPSYKVALVRGENCTLQYTVRIETLKNVCAFVEMEA